MESSHRKAGDKAWLASTWLAFSTPQCMRFYYNMYGRNIGKLTLYLVPEGKGWLILFTKTGNQGQNWHSADVTLDRKEKFQVSQFFEYPLPSSFSTIQLCTLSSGVFSFFYIFFLLFLYFLPIISNRLNSPQSRPPKAINFYSNFVLSTNLKHLCSLQLLLFMTICPLPNSLLSTSYNNLFLLRLFLLQVSKTIDSF